MNFTVVTVAANAHAEANRGRSPRTRTGSPPSTAFDGGAGSAIHRCARCISPCTVDTDLKCLVENQAVTCVTRRMASSSYEATAISPDVAAFYLGTRAAMVRAIRLQGSRP